MGQCRCILCHRETDCCGGAPVCELHDTENLTEDEAVTLNLWVGGNFYKGHPKDDDRVEDGFGCSASAYCSKCGKKAMFVNRPGDIRCGNCR